MVTFTADDQAFHEAVRKVAASPADVPMNKQPLMIDPIATLTAAGMPKGYMTAEQGAQLQEALRSSVEPGAEDSIFGKYKCIAAVVSVTVVAGAAAVGGMIALAGSGISAIATTALVASIAEVSGVGLMAVATVIYGIIDVLIGLAIVAAAVLIGKHVC